MFVVSVRLLRAMFQQVLILHLTAAVLCHILCPCDLIANCNPGTNADKLHSGLTTGGICYAPPYLAAPRVLSNAFAWPSLDAPDSPVSIGF